jgi:hypothetical protein
MRHTIDRRLRSLEARIVRQGSKWDLTHLSDEDLDFIEACGRAGNISALSPADTERLEQILLIAGRAEGST